MLTAYFSGETLQARGIGEIYLKGWKGKRYSKDYFTNQGSHSDLMEKPKSIQTSTSEENSAQRNQFNDKC